LSSNSMKYLLSCHGFEAEVKLVYGNQYMWVRAQKGSRNSKSEFNSECISRLALRYMEEKSKLINEWRQKLIARKALGSLAIWGAAAKGQTFASEFGLELIDCAIDTSDAKQNRFMPVSAIK